MHRLHASLLLSLFLILGVVPARAQHGLRGFVRDAHSAEPIAGAVVTISDSVSAKPLKQSTHPNGEFRFRAAPKVARLSLHAIGYRDTIIERLQDTAIVILLEPDPIQQSEITITAMHHLSTVQDVPVSTEVVQRDAIVARNPNGLDDVLRYVPGVTVTDNQVNIRGSSGFSYDVGSRVLLMLDGTPMLSADLGDMKFDAIPLFDVERMEVVKGAGSALYGSSALGGVINVITRMPSQQFRGELNVYGGTYDQPSFQEWRVPSVGSKFGSIDGGVSGTIGGVGLLGSFGYKRNEGYRIGDDYYRWHGFAKGVLPISDNSQLTLSALLANDNHAQWVYWKSLAQPLVPFDSTHAVNARVHAMSTDVIGSLRSVIGESTIATVKLNLFETKYTTDPALPAVSTDAPGHSLASYWNGESTLSFPISSAIYLTNGITAGLQGVQSDQFQNHSGFLGAIFSQAEYKPVDRFTMNLGGRLDVVPFYSVYLFSPKIGMTYEPVENLTIRGSYGSGFRTPAISERFIQSSLDGFTISSNLNLKPEFSQSSEIGLNYRNDWITADGALFYSTYQNLIEPEFTTSGTSSGPYIQFQNVEKAMIFGHEENLSLRPFASAAPQLLQALAFELGYTYIYPENSLTHRILTYRPRNVVQMSASSQLGAFQAGVDFRYISKYEMVDSLLAVQIPNGDARVDAYVLDARLSFDLGTLFYSSPDHGTTTLLSFQVLNLLNYYYVEIVGNLAPLRSYSLRLDTTF